MIETRIKKALPHHKLFLMYLMDSICKNIGSPYNLIFAKNLFKVFTETYTFIPDPTTRQHLINLFKTWVNTKTSTGASLFPPDLITKIETFIINATKIPGNGTNQTFTHLNISKLTPDMLLRETKILLTYIINLNFNIERLDLMPSWLSTEEHEYLKTLEIQRNNLVLSINDLSDKIVIDIHQLDSNGNKTLANFEKNVQYYHVSLTEVRRELDNQRFNQDNFIKKISPKIDEYRHIQQAKEEKIHQKKLQAEFILKNSITIDPQPKVVFFAQWDKPVDFIPDLYDAIKNWGKEPVKSDEDDVVNEPAFDKIVWHDEMEETNKETSVENPLGFDLSNWDTSTDVQSGQMTNALGFTLPSWDLPSSQSSLGITITSFDLDKSNETTPTPIGSPAAVDEPSTVGEALKGNSIGEPFVHENSNEEKNSGLSTLDGDSNEDNTDLSNINDSNENKSNEPPIIDGDSNKYNNNKPSIPNEESNEISKDGPSVADEESGKDNTDEDTTNELLLYELENDTNRDDTQKDRDALEAEEDDDDDYTPYEPPPKKKSNLKRPNSINYGPVKRVRFDV
jgi:pre-mRNA cleavage complex 2 protein Pcf11